MTGRWVPPHARRSSGSRQPWKGSILVRRPFLTVFILGVMFVVGGAVVRQSRRPPPSDEPHRRQVCANNLQTLCTALSYLAEHCGRLPTTKEGLVSLIHNPGMEGWRGPYIFELKPDPWGRTFRYAPEPPGFRVWSVGPDGEPGTEDDIVIVRASATNTAESVPGVYRASIRAGDN